MVWMIEIIVLFAVFTLIVVPKVLRNPVSMVQDYPPDIYQKAMELGLVQESQNRKSKPFLIKRVIAVGIIGIIFGWVVYYFNGANSFLTGAAYTYILWTVANWYDALVIDCLWFCHSSKVVIPGTEGMAGYKDYRFHIHKAFVGMVLGIPSSVVAGIFVWLIHS